MQNLSIGQRILEIRGKEARHSFAKKLNIGTATLQRYENDERTPDLDFLLKLQDLTGLSLDFLVTGNDFSERASLNLDEELLLQEFRSLSSEQKKFMLKFLIAGFDGLNKTVISGSNVKIENSFNN